MGYKAKLVRGAQYLDLSSGRYALGRDFKPGVSTFSIKITGGSSAEVRRGVDDINLFLRYCQDPANPTYFEWRPDNNVSAEPVWGQGMRRVEVLDGEMQYWDEYFEASVRETVAFVRLSLTYGSVVEGARQLCATATGGVVEDWIGTTDGTSRGVQIPEGDATNGNKFTNPVFQNATWDTDWTPMAELTATKNTDPNFKLYGLNSAKITSSGATNILFYQSINPGTTATHTLSCYAKLPDSGSIGTAQLQVYCGSVLTTTYQSVGDGWYRCYGTVAGGTAAVMTGIIVKEFYTVYADAFQLEQRTYPTAFFYGDMVGCAWTGTAQASKSTRTASKVSIPSASSLRNTGTIRVVWKADKASTKYANSDYYLFSDTSALITGYYDGGVTEYWSFTLGSDALDYSGPFSSGDIKVFHIVYSPVSLEFKVYQNGTLKDSGVFKRVDFGTNLFIGSDNAGANQLNGTFLGFTTFGYAMTATEVAADYANVLQVIESGQSLDSILYIWTKDGDNIVDNVDSGAQENWAVIGGVPGDMPADIEAQLTTAGMNDADMYISQMDVPYNQWLDPAYLTTATVGTISVGAAQAGIATLTIASDEFELLAGRKLAVMVRGVEGTANNITLRTGINPGGAYYYTAGLSSNWGTAGGTSPRIDMSPDLFMVDNEEFYRIIGYYCTANVLVQGNRSSGTADFILNSAQIMPHPVTRFTNLAASGTAASIAYIDGKAYEATGSALHYTYDVDGKVELMPHRYNLLISYLGREGSLSEPADTLTYNAVYVTPKWKMM